MSAIRPLLIIGLILTASGFASETLGDYLGPLEYKGYLVFDYPEGENPINNIVFTVDSTIAGTLIIVNVPSPWSHSLSGGILTLTGGSLNPGGTVQVTVSVNKYIEQGEYPVSSVGTTTAGEVSNAQGVLLVGDLVILRFLQTLTQNQYGIAALTLGLTALEIYLNSRSRLDDTSVAISKKPKTCQELIDECEKAKAAAKAAEAEAKSAKEDAEKATKEQKTTREKLEKAEKKLERAKKDKTDDSGSWVEMDGRRINSQDLNLRKDASKALWDQYRNGDIDANELEQAWEDLGEHSALEELRKKSREARKEAAEKELEKAKDQDKGAKEKTAKAKKDAESAQNKAIEAKALADKICKEAEECLKQIATPPVITPPKKKPDVSDEDPETTWTTEETTETTETYEGTTETTEDYTTETTEETTRSTEDAKQPLIAPLSGTTIFGPRLGETGLTPHTPEKPVIEPPSESDSEEEEDDVSKCGPDVTQIYLKALNVIINRLRREYRSAPGGAWTDFWGARAAYGITFLGANGWDMDFWAKSTGGCPSIPKCEHTVTLMGECIVAHTLNDLIYGICAGFFGVPGTIQNLGGHFAQIMAYGGLDPEVSQKIYEAGYDIGEAGRHKIVKIDMVDLELSIMQIDAIKRPDCTPCLIPATDTDRDFSTMTWTWL